MKLAPYEIATPLWTKLVEIYTPKLADMRKRLESVNTPDAERAGLCWQIKVIKEFLALAEPEQKKGDGA